VFLNFSEPMNPVTVTVTAVPPVSFDPPVWGLGTNLVLSHSTPFTAATMYTLTVNGMDMSGNWLDGNNDGTGGDAFVWTFSTSCGGICIVDTIPNDGDVNIPVNSPIVVIFSERIDPIIINITIVPPTTFIPSWMNGDTVLTIQHTSPFSSCTLYTVTIASLTLMPGPVPNPWHFTTAGCAPMIMHIEPPRLNAPIDVPIVVEFSIEMDPDSVTGSLNRTVALNPTWGFGNVTLTLAHSVKFLPCTAYKLTVSGKDKIGRDLVPGPVENPYNFTTICTYPRVTQTSPFRGQTNVLLDAPISVTFSETMNNNSVEDSFSYIDDRMTVFTKSDGVFQWNADNTSFIFNPNSPYRGQVTHTVRLNASIAHGLVKNYLDGKTNGIMDQPRNVDDYTWQFTTALVSDNDPPYVQSVSPEFDARDVARDPTVTVVFSEAMNKPSAQAAIEASGSRISFDFTWPNNRTVTFRLIPLLFYGTSYTMRVKSSASDLVGNHMAEDYSWSFTTLYWHGSVHGRVIDEADGSPIANATVVLDGMQTITDAHGNFTFANVLQNPAYWLNVTRDGYHDNRTIVGVSEGNQDLGVVKLRKIPAQSHADLGIVFISLAIIVGVVAVVLMLLASKRRKKVQPTKFEEWKGEVAEVEPGNGRP